MTVYRFSITRINGARPKVSPTPEDIRQLRFRVQLERAVNSITAAQKICAAACGTSLRTWTQWEAGDRWMHPSFWERARNSLCEMPTLQSARS